MRRPFFVGWPAFDFWTVAFEHGFIDGSRQTRARMLTSLFLKPARAALCAAAFMLAPAIAHTGTPVTYTDAGRALFQFDVPDFWSLRTGGLRDLTGPEADDIRDVSRVFGMMPEAHPGVWVGLISPHGISNLQEATEYLRDIGPFLVEDVSLAEPHLRKIGGMPARSVAGTGRRGGKHVDFTVLTIDLPAGRVAIAVVVFEAGADTDPVADINAMLASIRSVR